MHNYYSDIIEASLKEPMWWDENGVPRFAKFTPELCPNIYADQVVLIETQCQCCHRKFLVQMSWYNGSAIYFRHPPNPFTKDRVPHYGDPPNHPECPAGNTMNVEHSKYVECWHRGDINKSEDRWVKGLGKFEAIKGMSLGK